MPRLIDAEALRPWMSKAVMTWIDREVTACCGTCRWWDGTVCGDTASDKNCTGMGAHQLCECWEVRQDDREAAPGP